MLPEFQKLMENILQKLKNTFTFSDDILIVTKGSKEDHLRTVEETIQVLDEARIGLKTKKCHIAQKQTDWLG